MTDFVRTAMASALACTLGLGLGLGCVVYVRQPETLEFEVIELVETREDALAACYDGHLVTEQVSIEEAERTEQGPYEDIGPAVSGRIKQFGGDVVLRFTVERKTGRLTRPEVVDDGTTAPKPLVDCVLRSLDGLTLDPADQREGEVTLAWRFKVGKRAKTRPPGMAPADEAGSATSP